MLLLLILFLPPSLIGERSGVVSSDGILFDTSIIAESSGSLISIGTI